MKQVVFRLGQAVLEEVPAPAPAPGQVLVEAAYSFISSGTELGGLGSASGAGNFFLRALQQPQNVLSALRMVQREGVRRTWMAIEGARQRGDATGYSCSGRILEIGSGVTDLAVGDRVACAGAAYAHHAEYVSVPRNLVVRAPEGLGLDQAASATLGAIAMQGVRRADVRLGERVAVVGLGLLGMISLQLLRASGCYVMGTDPDAARRARAKELGASLVLDPTKEDAVRAALEFGGGYGVDATVITAASSAAGILQQSIEMTRRKGRVVLVGAVPITFDRSPFYQKELDFLISCSYGAGRYDAQYEERGLDYPYAYVRWTENRNLEQFLILAAEKRIDIPRIVDRVFPSSQVMDAYAALRDSGEKPLGVLLEFPAASEIAKGTGIHGGRTRRIEVKPTPGSLPLSNVILRAPESTSGAALAVVGAGSFAQAMHLPHIAGMPDLITLKAVVDLDGLVARNVAAQYRVAAAATDTAEAAKDPSIDGVLISTRHNVHAAQTLEMLKAGKSVLCEKPAGLTLEELDEIEKAARDAKSVYVVDFNRRFSPGAQAIAARMKDRRAPLHILCRIAAGYLPLDHWTQGAEGGGRMIGEGCHWIDLMQFFVGDGIDVTEFDVSWLVPEDRGTWWGRDNLTVTLRYSDGSLGTLMYCAAAAKGLPKELIEIHWGGNSAILNDFKSAEVYLGSKPAQNVWQSQQTDKGHREILRRFAENIRLGKTGQSIASTAPDLALIPLDSILRTSRLSIRIDSLIRGKS